VHAAQTGHWDLEVFRPSFGQGVPVEIQDLILGELPKTCLANGATGLWTISI